SSIGWLSDGRLVIGAANEDVVILDPESMRGVAKLPGHVRHASDAQIGVAVSPGGDRIATGIEGTVRIWDAASAALSATTSRRPQDDKTTTSLAWSEDGKIVASGTSNQFGEDRGRSLATWDAATGKAISGPVEALGVDGQSSGVNGL